MASSEKWEGKCYSYGYNSDSPSDLNSHSDYYPNSSHVLENDLNFSFNAQSTQFCSIRLVPILFCHN